MHMCVCMYADVISIIATSFKLWHNIPDVLFYIMHMKWAVFTLLLNPIHVLIQPRILVNGIEKKIGFSSFHMHNVEKHGGDDSVADCEVKKSNTARER